jgi:protein involved in polysaccharide export with SLBB domain
MNKKALRRSLFSGLSLTLCLSTLAPVRGQDPSRGPQQMRPPSSTSAYGPSSGTPFVLLSSDEDYHIGATDVIDIRIEDAPELSGTFRVAANGTIPMPFVGQIVARDKTTEELSKLIANQLRGQYLQDPRVSIAVLQYNSRSFFVQGAVRQPGVYQIEGRPSLLKLITIAGGLQDNHGSSAFIIREIRRKPGSQGLEAAAAQAPESTPGQRVENAARASDPARPIQSTSSLLSGSETAATTTDAAAKAGSEGAEADGSKYELLQVNISGLLNGNFSQNKVIEPGDIVNIPPTDVFFVAGEVRSPGSYPLKDGTTLRQAVSLAQGLTFKAKASRGVIFREDRQTGKRQEIKVDISDVMSGKKEDVPLLANDVVIVPNSGFKTVTSTVLTAFGVNAARVPVY